MQQLLDSNNQSAQSFGEGTFKRLNAIQRYVCNVCNKVMARKDHYNYHMKTHTGEKPHKCNLCQKTFITGGQLNRHHRSHTGEKHYKCNLCEKQYASLTNLKYHIKVTH
ncbi:unnamed protein product [Owenia fusiformis]|uniref:C2H2-type domain-containing protein n=1 Tax=Owenia fusiformis TaxID=6347 RepID=A0A8S4NBK5_OWEFU|nr:unnamed protein product [Owenia fusiformis]